MDTNRSTLGRVPTWPRLIVLAAATALLTLAGCTKEYPRPPYVINPDPRDANGVTLTLDNAPDDLRPSSAYVQYRIVDTRCMPPVTNFAGVRREPVTHHIEIDLQRVDANTYVGSYFRDGLMEKDYYGHGVCRWEVTSVGVAMITGRTKSFAYFTTSASPGKPGIKIFSDRNIQPLMADGERYPASGWSEEDFVARVSAEDRSNYFSYKLSIDADAEIQSINAQVNAEHDAL